MIMIFVMVFLRLFGLVCCVGKGSFKEKVGGIIIDGV